jgi:hypothetical protein
VIGDNRQPPRAQIGIERRLIFMAGQGRHLGTDPAFPLSDICPAGIPGAV